MRPVVSGIVRILCWSCVVVACYVSDSAARSPEEWAKLRRQMVQREVASAGVKDPRVILAMEETPRHLFVPSRKRELAYFDSALPIGSGQTISPPFIVAYMTEQLDPQPTDKVLEIGTGSGYQAAVLSPLVAEVYSIEIVEPLAKRAASVLKTLDYKNVRTRAGDGFVGWPEAAPFDKIIVTCSPEEIPQALRDQLREGGRLVIPLGERFQQALCLFVKTDGELKRQVLEATFFVPMTGQAEALRKKTNAIPFTGLVNGGFEDAGEGQEPAGWYYIRQAITAELESAPEGDRVLRLTNRDSGRHAQVLQAVGLDGQQVSKIKAKYWVRTDGVNPGQSDKQIPQMRLTFYNENRVAIKTEQLGQWKGTSSWKFEEQTITVPKRTRLAVLMIGMFGAVGSVELDAITMEVRTG